MWEKVVASHWSCEQLAWCICLPFDLRWCECWCHIVRANNLHGACIFHLTGGGVNIVTLFHCCDWVIHWTCIVHSLVATGWEDEQSMEWANGGSATMQPPVQCHTTYECFDTWRTTARASLTHDVRVWGRWNITTRRSTKGETPCWAWARYASPPTTSVTEWNLDYERSLFVPHSTKEWTRSVSLVQAHDGISVHSIY